VNNQPPHRTNWQNEKSNAKPRRYYYSV